MKFLLDMSWSFAGLLQYVALGLALAGVGVFGWQFVRVMTHTGNAESQEIPPEAWRGPKARLALRLFLAGVAIQLFAMLLSTVLPQRP